MESSSSVSTRICFICLKETQVTLNSITVGDKDNNFKIFIKVFSRFIGSTKRHSKFSCCDECLNLTNKFCDTYHQYKCLEMQLDWMVVKIESLIKSANEAASRYYLSKHLKREVYSNQAEVPELVAEFREHIFQKCQLKLKNSLPRISLRRRSSPLPVLFQPVFITSSTESLNVTLDSNNEEYQNTAESDNGNELEDSINCNDDFDTARTTTDEIAEADITSSVDQIEPSLKQDFTLFTNSTEAFTAKPTLNTDNVLMSTSSLCKTEPLNEDGIRRENRVVESDLSSTFGTNTEIPRKEYNLRRKLPRNVCQQTDEDNDGYMNSKNVNLDSLSNISDSSFSSTSSESSSSEEEELETKPNLSSLNKSPKLRKKFKAEYKTVKVFYCQFGNCKRKFRIKQMFENHSKLHSKGKFPCKFCPKVKPNLVLLSSHELKVHGKIKNEKKFNEKRFSCARCPFKSNYLSDYEAHFAFTHFGVGMEPLKRRVCEKCKICNRDVWNNYMEVHFKAFHDTSKLTDQKIIRCKEDDCTAYFLNKWQLSSHCKLEHRLESNNVPTNLKCNICLKTFASPITLRRHKRHVHKYQLRLAAQLATIPAIQNDTAKLNADIQPSITESVDVSEFQCIFCSVVKEKPSDLALHEAETHIPSISSKFKKLKKTNRCPRCPYEYELQRAFLKHHLSTHQNLLNPECSSACKLCSGGNFYKANSERHFRTFHKIDDGMEAHKCDKCPAYFRKSCQLQMHTIKIHQQDHKCEICGKCMKTRNSWNIHIRAQHPGHDENPDLPLGCDFSGGCKKRFKTKAELDHHQKYGHQRPGWSGPQKKDGNKFNCDKCRKDFTSHTSLLQHSRKIHKDRPFVCTECEKAFGTMAGLHLHMEFHKGPDQWKWQCTECGKKCATKQKLDEHGRTHSKEKPFICQFCGGKYAHRHSWRNHLKMKHGDEEGVEEIVAKQMKGNYVQRKGIKRGDCIMAAK